jgi:hypothetical protein
VLRNGVLFQPFGEAGAELAALDRFGTDEAAAGEESERSRIGGGAGFSFFGARPGGGLALIRLAAILAAADIRGFSFRFCLFVMPACLFVVLAWGRVNWGARHGVAAAGGATGLADGPVAGQSSYGDGLDDAGRPLWLSIS